VPQRDGTLQAELRKQQSKLKLMLFTKIAIDYNKDIKPIKKQDLSHKLTIKIYNS
jgi:hypothetical protein